MSYKSKNDFTRFLNDFPDKTLAFTILTNFIHNTKEDISLLSDYLDQKDYEAFHRKVHAIKGGALNIGADPLRESSYELEKLFKDSNFFKDGLPHPVKVNTEKKIIKLKEITDLMEEDFLKIT